MFNKIEKILLTLVVVFSMVFTNSALTLLAAEDNAVIIDDIDDAFVYSSGDANHGGWESWGSANAAETEHWSNTAGATLDITFTGTKIELYGKAAPEHAMFSVSIDGGEAVKCDAYAASKVLEKKLYESETLADGEHVAHITVLGERNPDSTGKDKVYGVQFVYAKILTTEKPAAKEFTDIDDAITTTTNEPFKIQYEPAARWHAEAGYPNYFMSGTDHYSDKIEDENFDDYYTMTFTGTGLEIYGSKNTAHANCDVYIDGQLAGEVLSHLASGSAVHKQMLFQKKDLANKEHTVKVVRKAGETLAIQVDTLRVYHEEIPVSSIALNREEVRLGIGQSTQLNVEVEPWLVNDPEIIWTSADESIATVSEDGTIKATAKVAKETTVTATVAGSDISASVKVTIDPSILALNAYIGNEKVLDIQEDYDELQSAAPNASSSKVAWKGDTLNSKIVVASKSDDVHNVKVTSTDFTSKDGSKLSADQVSIKWLKEIKANDGRNQAGVVKSYPDVIYKGGAADIDAETVKFAWVNIDVPEDAKAGTYTGTITVSADELITPIDMVYTVEVLDLVQPEPEATEIQVWQHPFSVANHYLGLGEKPQGGISNDLREDFYFTAEHFNLMRDSMKEYASIGGHDAVANIVEEAWNHQSYYKDPSMVKWTKKADGTWEFDYTWYDAWVNFMIECGVVDPATNLGQIKCYSMVPWSNQIAYYDEATKTTVNVRPNPGSEQWTEMWKSFLENFTSHSKAKGWYDITYIAMDERGLDQLRPAVDMVESVTDENGNHFKISSALNYAAPQYYDFTDRIDDISINLGNAKDPVQMNELSEHRRALGLKTTYYSCTGDYPSNYTISDPGDNYWTLWTTMTLGTDGFMRWAWDNYVYDMEGDISYRYWEPGDGWFIYPVEKEELDDEYHASFYSTPRYEMFKQGIRDVAKAKYLMAQSDEMNEQIGTLLDGMQRPKSGKYHGSAVAANEEERMLTHSETDRVYTEISNIARTYAASLNHEDTTVVKAMLKSAMDKAEALIASDDFKILAPNVQAMIKVRLDEATAVYNDENAKNDTCLNAWKNLADALHYADFKADKTMLKALIDECEAMNTDQYTDASVKAFKDALAEANDVYADQNALQERINATFNALTAAKNGLTDKPVVDVDKEALADYIAVAKDVIKEQDKYIQDANWKAFVDALANAEAVFANENATQEEVNKAVSDLASAYEDIRYAPSEEMLKQLEDFINYTKKINRALYSAKDLKVIDDAANKAQSMLENKDFDKAEFTTFTNTMGEVMDIIDHNKIEKPADKDQNKNDGKQNGVKAPGTADTTNAAALLLMLIAGCGVMITAKKRKSHK